MTTCIRCNTEFEKLGSASNEEERYLCDNCLSGNPKLSNNEKQTIKFQKDQLERKKRAEAREHKLGRLAMPLMLLAAVSACLLVGALVWSVPIWLEPMSILFRVALFLAQVLAMVIGPFLILYLIAEEITPSLNLKTDADSLLSEVWTLLRKPLPLLFLIVSYGAAVSGLILATGGIHSSYLYEKDVVKIVLENDYYDPDRNPDGRGIDNDYELHPNGEIVIDHATGLYWQRKGAYYDFTFEDSKSFISDLNRKKHGGYDDWRIPTLQEAMSLIEPHESSKGLHIDSLFTIPRPETFGILTSNFHEGSLTWFVKPRSGYCLYGSSLVPWGNVLAVRSNGISDKVSEEQKKVTRNTRQYTKSNVPPFSFDLPNTWSSMKASAVGIFRKSYEQQRKQMFLQYNGNLEDYANFKWELPMVHGFLAPQKQAVVLAIVMEIKDAKTYLEQMEKDGNNRIQQAIHQNRIRGGSINKAQINDLPAVKTDMEKNEGGRMITYTFYMPDYPDKIALLHLSCDSGKYSTFEPIFNHIVETLHFSFAKASKK